MTYRLRNIVIAVALAILAALMTTFYVANYKQNIQEAEANITVYVAARDIPPGTPASQVIEGGFLKEEKVERQHVAPGAISSQNQIEGKIVTDWIYAREQVLTRRFGSPEEQGVRSQINGNLRAMQVPGDDHQLLGGTLKAGDRVDVVATWKFPPDGQNFVSRVVLRDLLVLKGVSQAAASSKLTRPGEQLSVTLAVTDSQSQKLFFVTQNGEWSLQLRPPTDAADSPEGVETAASLLADGLTRKQLLQQMSLADRNERTEP